MKSTESQRRFIESLAKGIGNDDLRVLLAPAYAMYSNSWGAGTLNQSLKGLSSQAASRCIEILKASKFGPVSAPISSPVSPSADFAKICSF